MQCNIETIYRDHRKVPVVVIPFVPLGPFIHPRLISCDFTWSSGSVHHDWTDLFHGVFTGTEFALLLEVRDGHVEGAALVGCINWFVLVEVEVHEARGQFGLLVRARPTLGQQLAGLPLVALVENKRRKQKKNTKKTLRATFRLFRIESYRRRSHQSHVLVIEINRLLS